MTIKIYVSSISGNAEVISALKLKFSILVVFQTRTIRANKTWYRESDFVLQIVFLFIFRERQRHAIKRIAENVHDNATKVTYRPFYKCFIDHDQTFNIIFLTIIK
jgi:hypothetical protein